MAIGVQARQIREASLRRLEFALNVARAATPPSVLTIAKYVHAYRVSPSNTYETVKKRIWRDAEALRSLGVALESFGPGGQFWRINRWVLQDPGPDAPRGLLDLWKVLSIATDASEYAEAKREDPEYKIGMPELMEWSHTERWEVLNIATDLFMIGAPPYLPHDYYDLSVGRDILRVHTAPSVAPIIRSSNDCPQSCA